MGAHLAGMRVADADGANPAAPPAEGDEGRATFGRAADSHEALLDEERELDIRRTATSNNLAIMRTNVAESVRKAHTCHCR